MHLYETVLNIVYTFKSQSLYRWQSSEVNSMVNQMAPGQKYRRNDDTYYGANAL